MSRNEKIMIGTLNNSEWSISLYATIDIERDIYFYLQIKTKQTKTKILLMPNGLNELAYLLIEGKKRVLAKEYGTTSIDDVFLAKSVNVSFDI
jgi:hypothetical protein